MDSTEAQSRGGARPWGRLAVTLLACVAVAGGRFVPLPAIDARRFEGQGFSAPDLFYVGLGPLVLAAVLVELARLVVPAWRRRRHKGPKAQGKAWAATVFLGGLFALADAIRVHDVFVRGGVRAPAVITVATLVAGFFLLLALAAVVSAHGLGNGVAVVVAASLGEKVVHTGLLLGDAGEAFASDARAGFGLLAAAAVAWAVSRHAAHRRARDGTDLAFFPASGLAALLLPLAVFALLSYVGASPRDAAKRAVARLVSYEPWPFLAFVVVTTAVACAFSLGPPIGARRGAQAISRWFMATAPAAGFAVALALAQRLHGSLATSSFTPCLRRGVRTRPTPDSVAPHRPPRFPRRGFAVALTEAEWHTSDA